MNKKNRLDEIKDEVKEFHPLLSNLFNNIEKIKSTEYTHGTNEFGLDFILTKYDDVLSEDIYVGVIAKIGKITQQGISEIKRQIDESKMDRLILSGTKKINVNEVWVITNSSFSVNAQEKINQLYKSTNIKYIDNSKLIELIDKNMENFWYDIDLELSEYLKKTNYEINALDSQLSLIKIDDKNFYIEQDFFEPNENEYKSENKHKSSTNKVSIIEEIRNNQFIILEGGIGTGKSKALRKLVDDLTKPEGFLENKILPVYVSYPDFVDKFERNLKKLITERLPNIDLFEDSFDSVLILLDGFDEKSDDDQKTNIIAELADNTTENMKILMTSRFIDGLVDNLSKLNKCKRIEIAPLSFRKTIQFLLKLCKSINLSDRLIEDLRKSSLMHDLARSPIAVILLARLLNENKKELPANLTELYSKYTEQMLGRWDIDKGISTQKEYQALENIIINISKDIIENEMISMSIEECYSYFEKYLNERNFDFSAKDLFDSAIKRTSILSVLNNEVSFNHRSFAEFFYAKYCKEKGKLEIDNRAFEMYWMNIYFFYIGLKKDCPKLLNDLITLAPEKEQNLWIKIVNMSNYFLAAYSTPYVIVEENLYKIYLDAAKLYLEIKNGIISSPLSNFSEVTLLWWFQYVLRESYSYEFFERAYEITILKIDETEAKDEVKLYSSFFLALTGLEMNKKDTFDFFIEKYGNKLPLAVQIGVFSENRKINKPSDLLKKQIKKIRKHMSDAIYSEGDKSKLNKKNAKDKLNKMFDKPVGKKG